MDACSFLAFVCGLGAATAIEHHRELTLWGASFLWASPSLRENRKCRSVLISDSSCATFIAGSFLTVIGGGIVLGASCGATEELYRACGILPLMLGSATASGAFTSLIAFVVAYVVLWHVFIPVVYRCCCFTIMRRRWRLVEVLLFGG